MGGLKRKDGSPIDIPQELWEAQLLSVLCADWGYPGIEAALEADSATVLRMLRVLDMARDGQDRPVMVPDAPNEGIAWAPAETMTQAEFMAMEPETEARNR